MKKPNNNSYYKYTEFKPPKILSGILEKIWVFDSVVNSEDDPHFGLIPDYTSSLIAVLPRNNSGMQLFVTGPNTSNLKFETYSSQITLGFRFIPGKITALFNIQPKETLNKKYPLKSQLSGSQFTELSEAVKNTGTIKGKSSIICSIIIRHINRQNIDEDEITDAINKIIDSDGSMKLETLYSGISISQRQFQRNFTKRTGISPKEFSRIVRFHKVTRKLVKNNFRHFDTLVESGYYDQSHYYREFREFLGMLPGKFESRQKKIEYKDLLK